MPNTEPVALKEWASAIRALERGKQIVLMRKGGIVEETREFRLESPAFWLYPTYEHQRRELLKDEEQEGLDETLAGWSPDAAHAEIRCYAEVAADLEVTDQERLDRIRDHHIWTDRFAEERLKWKRQKPLHVLLLRVYKLDEPVRVPIVDTYSGCKSWIRIEGDFVPGTRRPVLDDETFAKEAEQIARLLTF
ncbi:DUF1802 family protein [Paenibacillus flagellatus]|uniref:DUF1802 domain-containing protein n=1 Tax=Paenibacillus flagellatus TaxID=2211139 RepID=A0A2V5KDV9_9BACL|nr:DUF1802 family protein [Paenibacillus flagellatus]PYI57182.1 hypothetical protein DLM86_01705 [Paenibacillus flagellatus]